MRRLRATSVRPGAEASSGTPAPRRPGAYASALAVVLLAALVAAPALHAAVPAAAKIRRAVAQRNREAGRAQTLRIEVALHLEEGGLPAATGLLLSDPTGLARLELRRSEGPIERYLLRSGRILAVRDGLPVDRPLPLLPPVYMLQAPSGDALYGELFEFGGDPDQVELGYEGNHDCYVVGRRGFRASVWIDQDSLEVVRIDRGDGARFRLRGLSPGPEIQWPASVEIAMPGGRTVRLDFLSVSPFRAPAEAFLPEWLSSP